MKENHTADYRLQLHALQVYMSGSSLGSVSVLYKCFVFCNRHKAETILKTSLLGRFFLPIISTLLLQQALMSQYAEF